MTTDPTPARKESAPAAKQKEPKLLGRMESNPRDDWRLENLISVAKQLGIECRPPNKGSHYVFSCPGFSYNLTVPHKRPIKPVYVKQFTEMCRLHMKPAAHEGDEDE